MYSSCPACGSEMASSNGGSKVAETEKSLRLLDDGEHGLICKFCGAKQEHETVEDGSLSPSRPPLLSPAVSHRSSDSSISSCSECSVDVNSYNGGTQDDLTCKVKEKLHKQSTVVESNFDTSNKNMHPEKGFEEITEAGVERTNESFKEESRIQIHGEIWDPPEAEDSEDDMEGSVANYDDDDDECCDGINWSKPSALSSYGGEGSGSYKFKEEREKAIEEVINGKFRILVRQLLKSFGLDSSEKDGWVDIVTNLSWKAASFLKPEAIDGKAMDPDGYVKVKCIQTGSRCESELIKGMVFKKHAAHKHMPTTYKNPRLLLIRGMLGQSSSGLSSFDSMNQETEYMKSLIDMIETCRPDVILVEKSVSRDIQESILAKGMTLVFDMKLHRLERIARCTGSPIISSDSLMNPKLKHCDSFHIEKFVEELAVSEGGKRPSKTLMFLEGCPTRLGCTIFLKGSHSNELKKVKCVLQCAVVMAYQFILESSFLVDQKAMFESIIGSSNSSVSSMKKDSTEKSVPLDTSTPVDIPITNGFHEGEAPFSYEPYNPAVLSGLSFLSNSVKKAIGDRFSLLSSAVDPSLSSYFGLNGKVNDSHCDLEVTGSSDEEKSDHHDRSESLPIECEDDSDVGKSDDHNENQVQSCKDDIDKLLDSQSILVLMSSRNASTGTICEQSHFSHIKFYRNFDIPLGKFLRDNILNQSKKCSTCGKLPEAHLYYYVHRNKQLTVQVKRLQENRRLPGESEGKLWMWSRCGKCNSRDGTSHSTKRLLISSTARSLSFGKFLELSFSHYSSLFSGCGHSMREDFLHFFGLGPMVTLFSYSSVATYTVSLPPQKLEFNNPMKPELFHKETENVLNKGNLLFTEVSNFLKKLRSKFKGSTLSLHGSVKEFSDIEAMLKQERSKFEVKLENAAVMSVNPDVYKLLGLNRLRWELLLESCIWDRRLRTLRSPVHTKTACSSTNKTVDKTTDDLLNDTIHVLDSADQNIDVEKPSIEIKEDRSNTSVVAEDIQTGPALENPNSDVTPVSEQNIPSSSEPGDSDSVNLEELKVDASNTEGWVWAPFSELQERYMKHLQGSMFPLFESINSHSQDQLPSVYQLVAEEGSRLHIPLGTDDYIVSDYEGELSSIIACALTALIDRPSPVDHHDEDSQTISRIASMTSLHWPSSTSSFDHSNGHISKSFSLDESRFSSFDGLNLFDSLVSSAARHPEVSLGATKFHGKCKYSVLCVYAEEFRNLRNKCCPSDRDYVASLSRCKNWDAKGGKSKAVFAKTLDNRFIIKEIKKTEFESFVKFAPEYFTYMNQSFTIGNQTCLAKILGIYQVVIRQPKSGKEVKHDLMVMENLSYGRKISRQYDLKGALHARLNLSGDGSEDVLLDQNFVNDTDESPLYVSNTAKHHLQRAIWNDTTFLNSINVMDYSLLVGVDMDGHELVCGIIDYLRQYTWDKQLETWVKSSLVVPKNVLPTVISPKEYKKRFRKFMSAHFLSVPDDWCRQISFEEEDSSESKTRKQ